MGRNKSAGHLLIPIGNGGLFSAIHKGFTELKKIGLSDKLPKLVGVQIKNASPVKRALEQNKDYVILKKVPGSVAEGIVARESYCSPKVLRAIKDTQGEIIEVTEKETIKALREAIKRESLTPEPTSATVYAALKKLKLKNQKKITIVCIQTGNGMRSLEEILKII